MVWFQCEDCGDNLKKPKLANHFRQCSAFKLSCIDCGQVFGQQDVESHTQCITEAEKYGPKGQAKAPNGSNTKSKNETKQKPEVDINVGLSERPPWFCSLCNTSATSKQTLMAHADGKKHRAKARAFHASKQPPNDTAETKSPVENNAKDEVTENKESGESKDQNPSEVEKNALETSKKRKPEASENDISTELGNGEEKPKKAKHVAKQENAEVGPTDDKDLAKKKIKWKKLITAALKSTENGEIKFKKLCKFAVKSLRESGFTEEKRNVTEMLMQKVNSSSKFIVDGKNISFATSS
ncbi:ubp1-associated proteins 1c [Phtheirospermum japonicum]|uniref:Ubp1-associated proteins 1c n=1 Tax=Phtheirospermum japonicum TaxID=374723 RepID=A0A830DPC0_9LAMI|nr:ubp1-associated proteins 1c [Phtheirospermum japonicum]